MFFVVYLSNAERVLVPSTWIRGIGEYKTLLVNYGIPYLKGKLFKIFVSPNINDEPDFRLDIREQFDVGHRACYTGLIKYSFGKVQSYQLLWTKIKSSFSTQQIL